MDVTIAVATYGSAGWINLARDRAIPSAEAQDVPVIHCHAETLHDARNAALAEVETEWVIHLDADDELEPGYVEAMAAGTADVRGPVANYVRPNGRARPWQPRVAGHDHDCTGDCLPEGNWLLVGSAARTDLLRRAGGWEPWPVYEDWALWLRCWTLGATFELVRGAVYRAHVRLDSRNRGPSMVEKNRAHFDIRNAILPAAA